MPIQARLGAVMCGTIKLINKIRELRPAAKREFAEHAAGQAELASSAGPCSQPQLEVPGLDDFLRILALPAHLSDGGAHDLRDMHVRALSCMVFLSGIYLHLQASDSAAALPSCSEGGGPRTRG